MVSYPWHLQFSESWAWNSWPRQHSPLGDLMSKWMTPRACRKFRPWAMSSRMRLPLHATTHVYVMHVHNFRGLMSILELPQGSCTSMTSSTSTTHAYVACSRATAIAIGERRQLRACCYALPASVALCGKLPPSNTWACHPSTDFKLLALTGTSQVHPPTGLLALTSTSQECERDTALARYIAMAFSGRGQAEVHMIQSLAAQCQRHC